MNRVRWTVRNVAGAVDRFVAFVVVAFGEVERAAVPDDVVRTAHVEDVRARIVRAVVLEPDVSEH